MNKALLDTDTFSEIRKGKHPAITAKAKTYRKVFGYYSFSAVTVLEIVRGYQKAQDFQRLHAFLASIVGGGQKLSRYRGQIEPPASLPSELFGSLLFSGSCL